MLWWLSIYTHLLMKSVNESIYKCVHGQRCVQIFLSDLCISFYSVKHFTAQKMKFSIKVFFIFCSVYGRAFLKDGSYFPKTTARFQIVLNTPLNFEKLNFPWLFHDGDTYHIKTSLLICSAKQLRLIAPKVKISQNLWNRVKKDHAFII